MQGAKRISIIDGFRSLAIMLVIGFHYFVRFTPPNDSVNRYPYADKFASIEIFKHGNLGVHFFFIISGFVIFMTLESCNDIKTFALRRIIRLWPGLLICSVFTFAILHIFPTQGFDIYPHYFLPVLTFTDPKIWTKLFHFQTMDYIDGSVWSLVCEVFFYVTASILFFVNRNYFFRNWLIFVGLLISTLFISTQLSFYKMVYYLKIIAFPQHMGLFAIGMYFYLLHKRRLLSWPYHAAIVLLTGIQLMIMQAFIPALIVSVFIILFVVFVYQPRWLRFFGSKPLIFIGFLSYPLYLIHQNAGVVMMNRLAILLNTDSVVLTVVPVLTFLILVSYFVERITIRYINPYLRKILLTDRSV